jgi:hypothetical protein
MCRLRWCILRDGEPTMIASQVVAQLRWPWPTLKDRECMRRLTSDPNDGDSVLLAGWWNTVQYRDSKSPQYRDSNSLPTGIDRNDQLLLLYFQLNLLCSVTVITVTKITVTMRDSTLLSLNENFITTASLYSNLLSRKLLSRGVTVIYCHETKILSQLALQ